MIYKAYRQESQSASARPACTSSVDRDVRDTLRSTDLTGMQPLRVGEAIPFLFKAWMCLTVLVHKHAVLIAWSWSFGALGVYV